jgi:hypothetical protein
MRASDLSDTQTPYLPRSETGESLMFEEMGRKRLTEISIRITMAPQSEGLL